MPEGNAKVIHDYKKDTGSADFLMPMGNNSVTQKQILNPLLATSPCLGKILESGNLSGDQS